MPYLFAVKVFAYMINNDLYTSADKTRAFLKTVSHGKIDISNGFINGLSKKFSELTEEEREGIFMELMASDVLHSDFTFGRVNGKQGAVMINVNEAGQEFPAHVERYARGSEENEPGKTWERKIINWIKENVKWWNEVTKGRKNTLPKKLKRE